MTPFNLAEWKKNPTRKVVTREGKKVVILGWQTEELFSINGKIEGSLGRCHWKSDGRYFKDGRKTIFDLFFADDEPEKEGEMYLCSRNVLGEKKFHAKPLTKQQAIRCAKEFDLEIYRLVKVETNQNK